METRTRYDNLLKALDEIAKRKHAGLFRFMEIGTYDGVRAEALLRYWMAGKDRRAVYYGFDLFEDMTQKRTAEEMSKSRLPPTMQLVYNRLNKTGASIRLTKGDTRTTLTNLPSTTRGIDYMDLIFIDGGHSLETIDSDWNAIVDYMGRQTIVLLDDYYLNRDDFGCQRLVNRLAGEPERFAVTLLDPIDHYDHTGLDIRMVKVQRKFKNGDPPAHTNLQ